MNILFRIWRPALFWAFAGASVLSSCKKAEDVNPLSPTTSTTVTGPVTDTEVNDWILENMKALYYWNDKLPANPNKAQTPKNFFGSILYTFDATSNPTGDRFSWIQESAAELKSSLSGQSKTTGMELTYHLRSQGSNDIVASVVYVLPRSPAAKAGFKRGDIISKVNGVSLSNTRGTTSFFSNLLFGEGDTKSYGMARVETDKSDPTKTITVDTDITRSVTAVVFQENPVYLDSVYTIGSKKVGYLVYNQFVTGPGGPSDKTYDNQIDNVFAKFKAQGVNELILDFRYNPGGYVSSATNMAGLIAKGITGTKSVFTRKEWNATITPELKKQYGEDFFYDYLQPKANNIGDNLQRVYVLTTGNTASASELMINGLKPYFNQQVFTIGRTSYGKNVGSITIEDTKNKRIKWGMQPITTKSFNKDNQSDYSTGFVPTVDLREPLAPKPLGDVTERYLSEALFQITGTRTARRAASDERITPSVGSSIERKAGGSNMFFTDTFPNLPR